MLFKIVVNKQTRVFDCKEELTIEALRDFVRKSFPKMASFSFYYIDDDQDYITLQSKEDVSVYLEYSQKKPKIYVKQIEPQHQMFDYDRSSMILQSVIQIKKQKKETIIEILEKKEEPKLQEPEKEVKYPQKSEEKVDKNQQEKNHNITHQIKCNECGVFPIVGNRYKCASCQNYDLCEFCQVSKKHFDGHPLIKIRDSNCAPLEVQVQLKLQGQELPKKEEKKEKEEISNKMKQEKQEKREKLIQRKIETKQTELKFQSQKDKQILVVSLLESLFGSENSENYHQFAQITTERTEEKICQSFLNWLQTKRANTGQGSALLRWVGQKVESVKANIKYYLSFNSD